MQRSLIDTSEGQMADGRLDSGPDTTIVEFEATEKPDKELEEGKRNQSSFESNAVGSLMVRRLKVESF